MIRAGSQRSARRQRLALIGMLALALCAVLGMTLGGSAEAKKKSKKSKTVVFQQSLSPNAAIPESPVTGPSTPLKSSITVSGKKFNKKVVGDLNVTGIKTTGSGTAAQDLRMKLIAPNGRTIYLIGRTLGRDSFGPLTIDADSRVAICDSDTIANCGGGGTFSGDPSATLLRPFAGTANSQGLGGQNSGGVRAMNGVPMKGTWTFEVFDNTNGQTSVLNSWGLQITSAKPVT
jgi:subtilisin-like proprotein convertase family protein